MTQQTPNLDSLFEAALEIESPAQQAAFLDQSCIGDPQLRDEVERLLKSHREAGSFLDKPVIATESTMATSILGSLSENLGDVPRVVLRDADTDPILKVNSPEIPKGQNDGRYQLHGEIARGGMGAIIRGRDTDLGRELVVKVLLDSHKEKPEYVRRFIEEAQIAGQLQHPGIVPVYELGQFKDRRPFFTMKLVKGQTLAALLQDRKDVVDDRGKLLGIFEQICQTMAYAHSRGVIHRDLKPANVMVGAFGEVQIMDWGLAKVLMEGGTADEQRSFHKHNDVSVIRTIRSTGSDTGEVSGSDTRLGSVMGTLAYMPPEQALGEVDRLNERADVFALGAILSEILTGKPAYVAKDASALHRLATRGKLDECFARLDACGADHDVIQVAKACLSPEPEDRLKHADAVAKKVAAYLQGLQLRLKNAELDRIASESRRKFYAVICTLLALCGTGAVIAAGSFLKISQDNKQLAVEREEARRLEKVNSVATESRALRDERPVQSVLLAMEAVKLSHSDGAKLLSFANEALLNATQSLGGRPLAGHADKITDMAMSSDLLVTLGGETVRIWDLNADEPAASAKVLGGPDRPIKSMTMSVDGRWLVTTGTTLERWDLETASNVEPQVLLGGVGTASIGLSANGRWLVAQSEDGKVRLWDFDGPPSEAPRTLFDKTDPWDQILVTPDGHWCAVRQSEFRAQLVDLRGDAPRSLQLELRNGAIFSMTMSPDGRWLVTGDQQGVRIWDLSADNPAASPRDRMLDATVKAINRLSISRDCRSLFGAFNQYTAIGRWDLTAEGQVVSDVVLQGDPAGVSSLATSRDGRGLVSGGMTGTVRVWDLDQEDRRLEPRFFKAHDWGVGAVAMHPEGRWMATADGGGTARLWNLKESDPTSSPFVQRGRTDDTHSTVATSSDGRWVATDIKGNAVELWDTKNSFTPSRVLRGHEKRVWSIEFSHDDHWLITGSADRVQIWDLTSPDPTLSPKALSNGCSPIAVAHTSGLLAATVFDNSKTVRLWSLGADGPVALPTTLAGHEFKVYRMVMSPNDRWLVTVCQTNDPSISVWIRIWDLQAKDIEASCRVLDGQRQYISKGLTIDGTGRWLVTGGGWSEAHNSDAETVRLWDLEAEDTGASPQLIKEKGDVWEVAISPDARWLFTSRYNGLVQLWDLTGKEPIPHDLHECGQSVAMSLDGRWLAAGGRTHFNTLLFDLESEEPWSSPQVLRGHQAPIWSVDFSADSRWLVTDGSDGTVRRWCLDTDWLLDYAQNLVSRELTQVEREKYGLQER